MLCLVTQIVDYIQPIVVFTLNLYVLHKHEALNICGFESCWPVQIAMCSLLRAGSVFLGLYLQGPIKEKGETSHLDTLGAGGW